MIWPGQAPQHDADHGETDEGHDGARVSLEVARQAAVVADPRERTFHDPALGQDDELVQLGALDDFDDPSAGAGRGSPSRSAARSPPSPRATATWAFSSRRGR